MKGEREHRVPLSAEAILVLETIAEDYGKEGFVFPGARKGCTMKAIGRIPPPRSSARCKVSAVKREQKYWVRMLTVCSPSTCRTFQTDNCAWNRTEGRTPVTS